MKKSLFCLFSVMILALVSVGTAFAEEQGHGAAKGESVTLKGEVLDLQCYLTHPDTGKGPDHAKCATSCIKKGMPAGFLSGNQVYLLLGAGHGTAKDLVADLPGKEVSLTGKVVELNGIKALQVEKVGGGEAHGEQGKH